MHLQMNRVWQSIARTSWKLRQTLTDISRNVQENQQKLAENGSIRNPQPYCSRTKSNLYTGTLELERLTKPFIAIHLAFVSSEGSSHLYCTTTLIFMAVLLGRRWGLEEPES